MKNHVAIIGIGQLGGVFATGFLRCGYGVYPVTRASNLGAAVEEAHDAEMVLVAVAEDDLPSVLETVPAVWHDRICLLQNELLPRDWQSRDISNPTVVSVWFEKKKGMDAKVLISSPVYGPHGDLVQRALAAVDIPANVVPSEAELIYELVRKNVYIITINIAGLVVGGTVGALWHDHQDLARAVAHDVMDVQEWLVGSELDRDRLIAGMLETFEADPQHKCMGRTAPSRLRRALEFADQAGLSVTKLREISAAQSG